MSRVASNELYKILSQISDQNFDPELFFKEFFTKLVTLFINEKIGKFTKTDICELCPTISINSVEKQLTILSNSGEIVKCGSGKNTYYIKKL